MEFRGVDCDERGGSQPDLAVDAVALVPPLVRALNMLCVWLRIPDLAGRFMQLRL